MAEGKTPWNSRSPISTFPLPTKMPMKLLLPLPMSPHSSVLALGPYSPHVPAEGLYAPHTHADTYTKVC